MSDHPRDVILLEVEAERLAQDARWGVQNHPNGRVDLDEAVECHAARVRCQNAALDGTLTWRDIFREEALEALVEVDGANPRQELLQVAAVAVAWVEAIDRRASAGAHVSEEAIA